MVAQDTTLEPVRRLIVLVPNLDMDEVAVARQIWELASPPGLAVLFLGLCADIIEEPRMRRRLIALAALTRDARVPVETRLEFDHNWIRRVKAILGSGDIIVCHAEQRTGLWRKPLSQTLAAMGAPVWILAGFYPPINGSRPGRLTEVIFWAISMAILVGFFWLQVQIARLPKDWTQSTLLSLSVLVEVGLLWAWHHFSL